MTDWMYAASFLLGWFIGAGIHLYFVKGYYNEEISEIGRIVDMYCESVRGRPMSSLDHDEY